MKKQSGFEKFFPKKSNAAKKEQFKQEKRKWKKDMNEKREERGHEPGYRQQGATERFQDSRYSRPDTQNTPQSSRYKAQDGQSNKPQRPGYSGRAVSGQGQEDKRYNKPQPGAKRLELRPKEAFNGKPKLEVRKTKPEAAGKKVGSGSRPIAAASPRAAEVKDVQMPLNKYIAHGGVCSRRDAEGLVKGGKVKVNGELILDPGYKISEKDEVKVQGKRIYPVRNQVYILLNKPKDYLTTTDDPHQRKTVLDLIKAATPERVYPVGRLDRNTSGVLLLTNDGDLSQKLTHPSNEIKKVYAVTLDKPLTRQHFDEILKAITLEDGIVQVDSLAYTDTKDHTQVGIELHSGRNRIVRRIFEHFGYDVKNLDRVIFAGLTKKNVQRGKWRFLTEREVRDLKYFKRGR